LDLSNSFSKTNFVRSLNIFSMCHSANWVCI
jgi:hypothetical protein